MSLNITHSELMRAWNALRGQWQQNSALWLDQVRREFEAQFWQPIEGQMPHTLDALERVARIAAQARRDVR